MRFPQFRWNGWHHSTYFDNAPPLARVVSREGKSKSIGLEASAPNACSPLFQVGRNHVRAQGVTQCRQVRREFLQQNMENSIAVPHIRIAAAQSSYAGRASFLRNRMMGKSIAPAHNNKIAALGSGTAWNAKNCPRTKSSP